MKFIKYKVNGEAEYHSANIRSTCKTNVIENNRSKKPKPVLCILQSAKLVG